MVTELHKPVLILNHIPDNWEPDNFNNWIDKVNNHVKESRL